MQKFVRPFLCCTLCLLSIRHRLCFPVGGLIPLFHFPLSIPHWQDICLQSKQTLHIPQSCPPPNSCDGLRFYAMPNWRRPKRKLMSQLACYVLGEKNENYWFYVYVPLRPNAGDDVRASFFLGGGAWRATKGSVSPLSYGPTVRPPHTQMWS